MAVDRMKILLDCDWVLLNVNSQFRKFVHQKTGFDFKKDAETKYTFDWDFFKDDLKKLETFGGEFQNTDEFAECEAMPGAVEALKKLHHAGYDPVVVSASLSPGRCFLNRRKNLIRLFGPIFKNEHIILLPWGADKTETFRKFSPTFLVEDFLKHALEAKNAGHFPLLLKFPFNQARLAQCDTGGIPVLSSWQGIMKHILSRKFQQFPSRDSSLRSE